MSSTYVLCTKGDYSLVNGNITTFNVDWGYDTIACTDHSSQVGWLLFTAILFFVVAVIVCAVFGPVVYSHNNHKCIPIIVGCPMVGALPIHDFVVHADNDDGYAGTRTPPSE